MEPSTTEPARYAVAPVVHAQSLVARRYLLVDELGRGGSGRVWRARDLLGDRDVAIKVFHPALDDAQRAGMLRREREALVRLRHDGIRGLHDSGRHGDTHYLALEFVPGIGLDTVLARLAPFAAGRDPARHEVAAALGAAPRATAMTLLEVDWYRTAARVAVAILRAVAAAHRRRVFHRDLKPGNVLLRPDGSPVLLDFGLAGLGDVAPGTLTGRLFGTIAYMAPEHFEHMRIGKDAATDLYQCGLLLYELLTFTRAFEGDPRSGLVQAVRCGVVVPPRQLRRSVPTGLADVCMRALDRRPKQRYASAASFRADLERWLNGRVPLATRPGFVGRVWRRLRSIGRDSLVLPAHGAGALVDHPPR